MLPPKPPAVTVVETVPVVAGKLRKKDSASVDTAAAEGGGVAGATSEASDAENRIAEAIKEAKKMNPNKLKDALKARNLNTQGNKNDLLARLLEAIKLNP